MLVIAAAFGSSASADIGEYAARVGTHPEDGRIPNDGEPRFGGTLNIAEERSIPTLDSIRAPNRNAEELNLHVAEGLFAIDATGNPAPQLVADYTVSEDGTRYTFTLREGVPFHDGSLLTADDVLASYERWLGGPTGRDASAFIREFRATGSHTLELDLVERYPYILFLLSVPQNSALYVYPAAHIEAAGDGDIGTPIGTGPYRIGEFREGQWLRFERFDDYVGRDEPPSGFAGGKVAYLDEIVLHYIQDAAVRVAGLQAGQYHIAQSVNVDLYPQFADDERVRTRTEPGSFSNANLNKRQGLMADHRIRQAFTLAIDVRQIVEAVGPAAFNFLTPSMMPPGDPWHTEEGMEAYLAYDPERARELLDEAGYDGQVVRWFVNPGLHDYYTPVLIARPMLEAVGFNIDIRPVDQATLRTTRSDPSLWEVYSAGFAPKPDPTGITHFLSDYVGWWDTPEKDRLINAMRQEEDFDTRFDLWNQLHRHFYEYVPLVKFHTWSGLDLESRDYSGFFRSVSYYYYVNTWLND